MNEAVDINTLQYYAMLNAEKAVDEAETRNINMTEIFWKEIEEIIKSSELINININGQVRKGKSTLAIEMGRRIMEIMQKNGKTDKKFGIKNIFRDQQEFSRAMRNPEFAQTIAVIDERNELEEGGENVTAEMALMNQFSDVQAGRYVHKILCSPKDQIDKNSDIYLEVLQAKKKQMKTTALLYYNLFKGGVEMRMLLGYIEVSVKETIKNWIKIQDLFYKTKKTPEEEEMIKNYAKKDYYVEYMIRKYEKMELITREGIFRPRMLEYAKIILTIEKELREISKLGIINKDMIGNFAKKYCSDMKIPLTVLGKNEMTNEIHGILSLWIAHTRLNNEEKKIRKGTIKTESPEEKAQKLQMISKMRESIKKTINAQLEELERMKEIKEKYDKKEGQ